MVDSFKGLEREKWGLIPVAQIDSYRGLIFATFDPDAPKLLEYLGDMAWYLDILLDRREGGTEVSGPHRWVLDANWKTAAENFGGDGYHITSTHGSARELGIPPIASFRGSAVAGVDPRVMGIGPVPAVRKLLDRTGVAVEDIDLVELNEAFASQSVEVIRQLGLDPDRVNVNGGAIALGHPLGMSGARLVVSLVHELRRRGGRYGLATLCVGVGQGQAALFEAAR